MYKLKDMSSSQIDLEKVVKAYSRDPFILEVLMTDQSIRSFKYENMLIERDISQLNKLAENQVLCG